MSDSVRDLYGALRRPRPTTRGLAILDGRLEPEIDPKELAQLGRKPPQSLQYTIVSLSGNSARVQVTGFLDDIAAGLGVSFPMDKDIYRSANERVYVMKREGGR